MRKERSEHQSKRRHSATAATRAANGSWCGGHSPDPSNSSPHTTKSLTRNPASCPYPHHQEPDAGTIDNPGDPDFKVGPTWCRTGWCDPMPYTAWWDPKRRTRLAVAARR